MRKRDLLLAALWVFASPAVAADPVWTQYAPGGKLIARAIVESACPQIVTDGKTSSMAQRGKVPSGHRLVCEADVTGKHDVSIGGTAMHMPSGTPKVIVIIGDTGCRVEVKDRKSDDDEASAVKIQDCNDTMQWPFATLAQAAATNARPDLVIHVGDYLYRESPCPADHQQDCGSSQPLGGDNWQTWDADFFAPAAPLLKAAPWIFVRGNHEICDRSGQGWTYYLDPNPYDATTLCADNTAPYQVEAGSFQAWVVDSSSASFDEAPAHAKQSDFGAQVALFASQFQQAAQANLTHAWLLTHRPLWGVKAGAKGDRGDLQKLNAALQAAWNRAPIPGVDIVAAGHTHLFELLGLSNGYPVQAVLGNGGTRLARKIGARLQGQDFGATKVTEGIALDDFGYAVVNPSIKPGEWSLELRSDQDKKLAKCAIASRAIHCKP